METNEYNIKFNFDDNMIEFCLFCRLLLISKLEQVGLKYNSTLKYEKEQLNENTTSLKKYFAFAIADEFSEREFLNSINNIYKAILAYMQELGDINNLAFNIQEINILRDNHNFKNLVRGICAITPSNSRE